MEVPHALATPRAASPRRADPGSHHLWWRLDGPAASCSPQPGQWQRAERHRGTGATQSSGGQARRCLGRWRAGCDDVVVGDEWRRRPKRSDNDNRRRRSGGGHMDTGPRLWRQHRFRQRSGRSHDCLYHVLGDRYAGPGCQTRVHGAAERGGSRGCNQPGCSSDRAGRIGEHRLDRDECHLAGHHNWIRRGGGGDRRDADPGSRGGRCHLRQPHARQDRRQLFVDGEQRRADARHERRIRRLARSGCEALLHRATGRCHRRFHDWPGAPGRDPRCAREHGDWCHVERHSGHHEWDGCGRSHCQRVLLKERRGGCRHLLRPQHRQRSPSARVQPRSWCSLFSQPR